MNTNIATNFLLCAPLLLIIVMIKRNFVENEKFSKYYILANIFIVIELLMDNLVTMCIGINTPLMRGLCIFMATFGFTIVTLPAFFILSSKLVELKMDAYIKYAQIPVIINALITLIGLPHGWVFVFSETNAYSRGPLFGVQLVISCVYMCVFLYLELKSQSKYMKDDRMYMSYIIFVLFMGVLLQILFSNVVSIWGTAASVLMLYYILLRDRQFRFDTLTKVQNRMMFQKHLRQLNGKKDVTIIMVDLNYLKVINDKCGHTKGDEYLCSTADALNIEFKDKGITYRIGGDEFCMLCENLDLDDVGYKITAVEKRLSPYKDITNGLCIISYGCSRYMANANKDINSSLDEADKNMYLFKESLECNPR